MKKRILSIDLVAGFFGTISTASTPNEGEKKQESVSESTRYLGKCDKVTVRTLMGSIKIENRGFLRNERQELIGGRANYVS